MASSEVVNGTVKPTPAYESEQEDESFFTGISSIWDSAKESIGEFFDDLFLSEEASRQRRDEDFQRRIQKIRQTRRLEDIVQRQTTAYRERIAKELAETAKRLRLHRPYAVLAFPADGDVHTWAKPGEWTSSTFRAFVLRQDPVDGWTFPAHEGYSIEKPHEFFSLAAILHVALAHAAMHHENTLEETCPFGTSFREKKGTFLSNIAYMLAYLSAYHFHEEPVIKVDLASDEALYAFRFMHAFFVSHGVDMFNSPGALAAVSDDEFVDAITSDDIMVIRDARQEADARERGERVVDSQEIIEVPDSLEGGEGGADRLLDRWSTAPVLPATIDNADTVESAFMDDALPPEDQVIDAPVTADEIGAAAYAAAADGEPDGGDAELPREESVADEVDLASSDIEYLERQSAIYSGKGELDIAIDILRRLIELNPHNPDYFLQCGVIRRHMAKRPGMEEPMLRRAAFCYEQSAAIDRRPDTLALLAFLYTRLAEITEGDEKKQFKNYAKRADKAAKQSRKKQK